LAAELQRALSLESDLVVGGRGQFDVELDGKLVFSRHQAGRFPEARELIEVMKP
jgi:selT/selW/selH-like putative selenoprotein